MLEILMFGLGAWMGYYVGKTGEFPQYLQDLYEKVFKK